MKLEIPTDQQVMHEALLILLAHMEPWNVARFVAACKLGKGDYLNTKDQLFAGETVDSLYKKIQAFEAAKNES
ncbi:hypothetical protein K9N68_20935 [Kovacikia minuta CCNUW1]|uniref:hypothetical protein n=1 Tax=Kovacikia minuta TaxID=2931930 RepID=UPI001CCD6896|nr:hypothetical protein [Kovacikia minuta]UBF24174.1 hypothetical protein K9N68_20935 [Kovacikia minuta CCNUW1]